MQSRLWYRVSLPVVLVALWATPALEAKTFKLYYLGGQSNMDGYGYSDKWHYHSAGYIDLGTRFAEALAGPRR